MAYDPAKYLRIKATVTACNKRWRDKNKEALAAKKREKYAKDPSRIQEINRKSNEKNKAAIALRRRANRPVHREYERSRREEINAQMALNRPAINASISRWKKKNPDKVRAYSSKRQALQRGASVDHRSSSVVSRLRKLQRNLCAICKESIAKKCHVDHITPIALGGVHEFTNLQLLCPPCNLRKAAKHPIAYAQSIGMLL